MRDALATRDIATVYRLLGTAGISQRSIAALTSQSQPDIAAVLGGRQVMSYDLLDRIATGLAIPRGSMGLAYSADCTPTQQDEEDESVKRRRFLAHAGQILTGAAIFGDPGEFVTVHADTPIPHRIGMTDIAHIEQATERLGSLESRYGPPPRNDPGRHQGLITGTLGETQSGGSPRSGGVVSLVRVDSSIIGDEETSPDKARSR